MNTYGFDPSKIIIEEVGRSTVFLNKEALYPEFCPPRLVHREAEIRELTRYFKFLLSAPGSLSQKILIYGGIGVGKTCTSMVFGREFSRIASDKGVNVKYVHVNCHRARTKSMVMLEIARQIGAPIPPRGLSDFETYLGILEYLEDIGAYVIIALDEFDYFVRTEGSDAAYFYVRTYDDMPDLVKRVNFIFIGRDISELSNLDSATASYLLRHMIKFSPYTARQLYAILDDRRKLAFKEGAVVDEVLEMIAEMNGIDTGGSGNARAAIELLLLAGEKADAEGSDIVLVKHVREAIAALDSIESSYLSQIAYIKDTIIHLPLHELLIYAAAVISLRVKGTRWVRMGDLESQYEVLCESYGEKPRGHTQVYGYILDLARRDLIRKKHSGKGYRGKSTLIAVDAPLEIIEKILINRIETLIKSSWRG